MTICASWLRQSGTAEELVFCTDSRLRSYGSWDANPKIFTFTRSDCAICFSGDTVYSYPLIIQLKNSVDATPKAASRFQRLEIFKQTVVKIINELISYKSDFEEPKVDFLLGGYCWDKQAFLLWKIVFDAIAKAFRAELLMNSRHPPKSKLVFFIGDYVDEAIGQVNALCPPAPDLSTACTLDMQPFQALVSMLESETRETDKHQIGGPPQLLKIYKSLNRVPFGVKWKISGEERVTLFGMPVHNPNSMPYPIIDPATLKVVNAETFKTAA
jgi:hypothetical protein